MGWPKRKAPAPGVHFPGTPVTEGCRLVVVDLAELQQGEQALLELAQEGYMQNGEPLAVGSRVLFTFYKIRFPEPPHGREDA